MSQRKNRKPLTDTLAQQFVYGEKAKETTIESSQATTPTQPKQDKFSPRKHQPKTLGVQLPSASRLMDKFQAPSKEATVRFTVDLPMSMHRKLSLLAARTGKKKAEIVRVLLDEILKNLEDD